MVVKVCTTLIVFAYCVSQQVVLSETKILLPLIARECYDHCSRHSSLISLVSFYFFLVMESVIDLRHVNPTSCTHCLSCIFYSLCFKSTTPSMSRCSKHCESLDNGFRSATSVRVDFGST
jgi:hypothetical protein